MLASLTSGLDMDFEAKIPVQISCIATERTRASSKLKLNHTTGSLELEEIIRELDENSVKSMDTSLDSGLKQKRGRRKQQARLLSELKSDLGPKFALDDDHRNGNLRSKYGRLQKVNEVGTGYVPSDLLRMKKISSPVKSPTKPTTVERREEHLPESKEPQEENNEKQNKERENNHCESPPMPTEMDLEILSEVAAIDCGKTLSPLPSQEAIELDTIMDVEESLDLVVQGPPIEKCEPPPKVLEEPINEEVTVPVPPPFLPHVPATTAIKEEEEEHPAVLNQPSPIQVNQPSQPSVIPDELPPPPAPQNGRRLSMRKMSALTTNSPSKSSPLTVKTEIVPPSVQVKEEAPLTDIQEVRKGVMISPDCLDNEKFLALSHLIPGQLIWGIFSKYPSWPCMICPDEKGIYVRQTASRVIRFTVHVRFFGPRGLNSWISPSNHILFDAADISDDLRYGVRLRNYQCSEKQLVELNWAIEDAQLVATEEDLEKRGDVFHGIIHEQFTRWQMDKAAEKKEAALNPVSVKRRRSSITSNNSESVARVSLDGAANSKKRIKLSTPVMDNDTSTHSFSSALSTTSSSGVSTMGKLSDTLSDEEMLATPSSRASKKGSAVVTAEKNKKPEESLEEKLTTILKVIPGDFAEMRREKREELCRNCTQGGAAGQLRHCSGSCGGRYHDQCLDAMAVSLDRVSLQQQRQERSNKRNRKHVKAGGAAARQRESLEDEGVEMEDTVVPPIRHVTGDSMIPLLPQIPAMPELMIPVPIHVAAAVDPTTTYQCKACRTGHFPDCFICHEASEAGDRATMTLCSYSNCGRAFHLSCLAKWPQAKRQRDGFVCPAHQCHLCISDDPRSQNFKQKSKQKLYKCIICPTAYHLEQNCLPAGTEIVGALAIICQRHFPLAEAERERKVVKGEDEVEENNNNSSSTGPMDVVPVKPQTASKRKKHVPAALNVNWCFICARGGVLVCCDQCPTAFHTECLKLSEEDTRRKAEEKTFLCEECELGRFPLYGELVWAKFGSYRWWPAVIMPEGQVPQNLNPARRSRGEFCIKFLGSNDHAWIGRKRVFLYTDDDALLAVDSKEKGAIGSPPKALSKAKKRKSVKGRAEKGESSPLKELTQWSGGGGGGSVRKGMEEAFRQSMLEARVMNGMLQARKQVRQQELSKLLRPVPFFKLKTNRPVAPVKLIELRADAQEDLICNCAAIEEPGRAELVACGPSSKCLNRLLLTECNPAYCPAGQRCDNQRLQKRQYPSLDILRTAGKGWGLVAKEHLKAGDLVVEYVGELINNAEMRRRIAAKEAAKDDVYYFLTLTKDLVIDAERKGNMARFMNHSCDPNCESEKWTVNGNTRVGIFAKRDIEANTELTFNYHWESTGTTSTMCQCGARQCKGFIGGDPKKS